MDGFDGGNKDSELRDTLERKYTIQEYKNSKYYKETLATWGKKFLQKGGKKNMNSNTKVMYIIILSRYTSTFFNNQQMNLYMESFLLRPHQEMR